MCVFYRLSRIVKRVEGKIRTRSARNLKERAVERDRLEPLNALNGAERGWFEEVNLCWRRRRRKA